MILRAGAGFFLPALLATLGCGHHPAPAEAPEVARSPSGEEQPRVDDAPPPSGEKAEPAVEEPLPTLCPPDDDECAALLPASIALDDGDLEGARRLLDRLGEPENKHALGVYFLLRGRALLESESLAYGAGGSRAEKAASYFSSAEPLLSHPEHARLQRARALLALGRGDEALADLEILAGAHAGDAEVAAALGIAYLAVGRAARSLEPLKRAARLDPQEPERHLVLGTAYMLLGDLSQAERSFRTALGLDSSSARAHGDLGAVLLVRGSVAEGRAHLKKATELEPSAATYASNLAYAELLEKRPEEAKKVALHAIHLDGTLASAWLNLGLSEVALGNLGAARKAFETAQQLDPSDPRPQNNLSDLDEIEQAREGVTPEDDSAR